MIERQEKLKLRREQKHSQKANAAANRQSSDNNSGSQLSED
jgi:hypothetical protein